MTAIYNVTVLNNQLKTVTFLEKTWEQALDLHNCGRYTVLKIERLDYTQESIKRALGIET